MKRTNVSYICLIFMVLSLTATVACEQVKNQVIPQNARVSLEQGSSPTITIGATGDQSYSLGDTILLYGTNSIKKPGFLFITGPNLPPNGGSLTDIFSEVVDNQSDTFTQIEVQSDGMWEYQWDTTITGLDPGIYTIFAEDAALGAENRTPKGWDCISFIIQAEESVRDPSGDFMVDSGTKSNPPVSDPSYYISGTLSEVLIQPGSPVTCTGVSTGEGVTNAGIWIFGTNLIRYYTIPVQPDGSYLFTISGDETKIMDYGQYFVLLQSPGENGILDIYPDNPIAIDEIFWNSSPGTQSIFSSAGSEHLPTQVLAYSLVEALSDNRTDDIYTKIQFLIDEETRHTDITINPVGTVSQGTMINIEGTSILPAGTRLLVRVIPSTFIPVAETGIVSGAAGCTIIQPGENNQNTWFFPIDTSNFTPDEYHIVVSSPDTRMYAVTYFLVQ